METKSTQSHATQSSRKRINDLMLCYNFSSVLAALPILHAVQGRKSVEEHVEQPVVQQDVCQFGAGVDKLQQHTKDVVHQGVLIKGVLNKTQHRDDAAPSER